MSLIPLHQAAKRLQMPVEEFFSVLKNLPGSRFSVRGKEILVDFGHTVDLFNDHNLALPEEYCDGASDRSQFEDDDQEDDDDEEAEAPRRRSRR